MPNKLRYAPTPPLEPVNTGSLTPKLKKRGRQPTSLPKLLKMDGKRPERSSIFFF